MAKEDFDYIAFKILAYYYSAYKNKVVFNQEVLKQLAMADNIDETYFLKILRSLANEDLIEGLTFVKAWGNEYILCSQLIEGEITPAGIRYLKEDNRMKKAFKFAETTGGLIMKLLPLIV